MKLELGQKVRVVNKNSDAFGAEGVIIDIDYEWVYPYEVDFGEGVKYEHELFDELDIDAVITGNKTFNKDSTNNLFIKWQEGVVEEVGVNGVQIEDIIDVLVERLQGFQSGDFPCRENALAVTKLEEARMWLNERTRKRKLQGVEGRNVSHT